MIPVNVIELDRSNPRIRKFLEMYGDNPTPEQIFLALGAGSEDSPNSQSTTYEKLKQSILTNRGIINPIILNRRPNDTLVCIEGNTRVALYKDFLQNDIEGDWSQIPALVHDELDSAAIHAIRLQVHLVGPRPWDPYSKAKYLYELRTQQHLPFAAIVDYCGGRQAEVVESINAYTDMEQYYRPVVGDDGLFDTTRFSGFVELQKHGIKQSIIRHGFNLHDFASWIEQKKIYPLSKVRSLPRVLRDDRARDIFIKQDIRAAEAVLERPDINKALQEAGLTQLAQAFTAGIRRLTFKEYQDIANNIGGDTAQALTEAQEELDALMIQLGLKS